MEENLDTMSLQAYLKACDDDKRATHQFTSRQELDFINHPNQKTFYKYVFRALGKQLSAHHPVDTNGKLVIDDVITACRHVQQRMCK